tara:strand:+ start:187 stop:963 length:777 start_codon:yes stop_codon:yes gene_type:complete
VVDLPWEEPAAVAAPVIPTPAEAVQESVSDPAPADDGVAAKTPEIVAEAASEPVAELHVETVAVVTEEAVVIEAAQLPDNDADDEPPLGDYDYVEMDAESMDYDFGAIEPEVIEAPEPSAAAVPATGLSAEWLELFPKLGLAGMTGSIGANCTLISVEGDNWLLHLDPAHSALFNPTQQRRLNDALNQQQGRELKLHIELIKPEQETPAQAASRKRANRQREAEESIHNDPLVQQMIEQFTAVIRADSIEPIDPIITP